MSKFCVLALILEVKAEGEYGTNSIRRGRKRLRTAFMKANTMEELATMEFEELEERNRFLFGEISKIQAGFFRILCLLIRL